MSPTSQFSFSSIFRPPKELQPKLWMRKSGEGPQKCAKSLLIPCVFFLFFFSFSFFYFTTLCGMVGGKEVWMRMVRRKEALVVKKKNRKVVNKLTTEMYLIPSHPLCFLLFFHTYFYSSISSLCALFCFFRKVDGWGEEGE